MVMMSTTGKNKGFTIIELIVVLVIIGLVVASSIPVFSRFQAGRRLRTSIDDISAVVRTAQSQAMTTRRPYEVILNTVSSEFWIENDEDKLYGRKKRLARGVQIETISGLEVEGNQASMTFVTHGGLKHSGEEGPMMLTLKGAKGKTQDVVINALTGAVKVQ